MSNKLFGGKKLTREMLSSQKTATSGTGASSLCGWSVPTLCSKSPMSVGQAPSEPVTTTESGAREPGS